MKEIIDEIEWIFRDYKFNNHLGVEIKDGKFIHTKYVENHKDTKCCVCDVLDKMKNEVIIKLQNKLK